MKKLIIRAGERYGRFIVISEGIRMGKKYKYLCKCDCGNEKHVAGYALKDGTTQSCGCLHSEISKKVAERMGKGNRTHGASYSRLYSVYQSMKDRCNNPRNHAFANYGGRGIKISSAWETFEAFQEWAKKNGYQRGLTLDRADCNGDYSPENCRWVSMLVQQRNRRNNRKICINGKEYTLSEIATPGLSANILRSRLKRGLSINEALSLPYRYRKNNLADMECSHSDAENLAKEAIA